MAKKKLPILAGDASVRVWVNKELGKVVADIMGTGDNLLKEDYDAGYGAYSLPSSYDISDFPDEKFTLSKLEDVNDGDIDYDGDTVSSIESSMVLMKDTDDYYKPEHFDAVMEELDLAKTGWEQVMGPELAVNKPKFRITFRSEVYIEAESQEEAEAKFCELNLFSKGAKKLGAEYVETCSVEKQ